MRRFCVLCSVEVKKDGCISRYSEVLLPLRDYEGWDFLACTKQLQAAGYVPLIDWQAARSCNRMPVDAQQLQVLPGEHVKVSKLHHYHTKCYMLTCEMLAEAALKQLFNSVGKPLGLLLPSCVTTGLVVSVTLRAVLQDTPGGLQYGVPTVNIASQLEVAATWKEWTVGDYRQHAVGFSQLEVLDPEMPQRGYRGTFTDSRQSFGWLQGVVSSWRLPKQQG